jgi:response regulator RpfG family c-di-GMP phosphodiesterase
MRADRPWRGRPGRRGAPASLGLLVAVVIGAAAGLVLAHSDVLPQLEQDTVSLRFAERGPQPAGDIAVVAIDDKTFDVLALQWPFARSVHAKAIDALRRAGARRIVYDVQFTEPTVAREDNALIGAVGRARNVVLATTETDAGGGTDVLGGDDVLRAHHARAAAANVVKQPGGDVQKLPAAYGGLTSLAVAGAQGLTAPPPPGSGFQDGQAWIDFRGPPGTIPTYSFSDLILGRIDPARLRGKVVVVGAGAPTLQDLHPTPAGSKPMSGPELQANAIWTVMHDLPLRDAPGWLGVALVLALAALPALACRLGGAIATAVTAPAAAIGYLLVAQLAFDHGTVLPVSPPLLALAVATLGACLASYAAEQRRRRQVTEANARLEAAVTDRTAELRATQLEVVRRLGQAAESRDGETGAHIERMSRLCERVALAMGLTPAHAERLRHAALLHDVGKIGIPDSVLNKPGRFDAAERAVMERHTTIGASILAGSESPLVQLAERIALTHHERWDGSGYPAGLRGEQIPLEGRICAICDVFDALVSTRPYKEAWTIADALALIVRERGAHFDPQVVDVFLTLADQLEAPARPGVAPEAEPAREPVGAGASAR